MSRMSELFTSSLNDAGGIAAAAAPSARIFEGTNANAPPYLEPMESLSRLLNYHRNRSRKTASLSSQP